MKIEKLFKKIGKFFDVNNEEKESDKSELLDSLEKKIVSLKEKIKETPSETKKEKLKKQLSVLQELKSKI